MEQLILLLPALPLFLATAGPAVLWALTQKRVFWAKLGLFFGTMMAAFIALYGWFSFQHDLQREATFREQHLLGLATSTAAAIDGDEHQGFRRGEDSRSCFASHRNPQRVETSRVLEREATALETFRQGRGE